MYLRSKFKIDQPSQLQLQRIETAHVGAHCVVMTVIKDPALTASTEIINQFSITTHAATAHAGVEGSRETYCTHFIAERKAEDYPQIRKFVCNGDRSQIHA